MANFKGILMNMVESEVTRFAEKHDNAEKYSFYEVVDGTLELENGNKTDNPSWRCEIRKLNGLHSYRVSGYIDNFGSVEICLVSFERTYCDADGSNKRTKHYYIHGDELKTFAFDK